MASHNNSVQSNNTKESNTMVNTNTALANLMELITIIQNASTSGLKAQVSNLRTISFNGRAFKDARAFSGTGLEEQSFHLIAHQGVERTISLKGLAVVNSQARVMRKEDDNGVSYAWDLVYPSYYATKFKSKIPTKQSFGDGFAPSVKTDGYVIAMATDTGLQPMFAEDSYRGNKEMRVPLSVLLQSSVANLDPQGDIVRDFILKSLVTNKPALLAANYGLELRVALFFEDFKINKNKEGFEDAPCPYYVNIKGDCFAVWARPFNPDAFKVVESRNLAERVEQFKKDAGIGRFVNGMSEEDYKGYCRIMGLPYSPRGGAQAPNDVSAPLTQNKTLDKINSGLAKSYSTQATVEEFIEQDPGDLFDFEDFAVEEPLTPTYTAAPAPAPAAKLDSFEAVIAALKPFAKSFSSKQTRAYNRIADRGAPLSTSDYDALIQLAAVAGQAGFKGTLPSLGVMNGEPAKEELAVDVPGVNPAEDYEDEAPMAPRFLR